MLTPPEYVYIHWPFCSSKCHYCDFVSLVNHEAYQEQYHAVLCKEIEQAAPTPYPIKTIFLGGGTPSLYPPHLLTKLFQTLHQNFDTSTLQEVTIEANPADITEERLALWQELGINRLSMGVQCLNDTVLQSLNRRQRVSDVEAALRKAPKYFNNISVDLILGLPSITREEWLKTLQSVVTWPIRHLSIYFLTIHEKTPLYFKVQQETTKLSDDQELVEIYAQTVEFVEKHGFLQYEISNFAQQGYDSAHNCAYWDRKPYHGFGLGASSFDGQQRMVNTSNLMTYLKNADSEGFLIEKTVENLTPEQAFLEYLMLGLRQKKGINLQHMVYFESDDKKLLFNKNVTNLIHEGLLEESNGTIRLTLQGMMLENDVVVRLL